MSRLVVAGGRLGVCVLGAAALVSCGKESPAPSGPVPSELRIRPPSVELLQLDSAQVVPSVLDAKGVLLSGVSVTFQSAGPTIATVSNVGVITSVGPVGATAITARARSLTATIPVSVRPVATRLTLEPSPAAIDQKATLQLTATLFDRTNTPIASAPISWLSSDTTVARVTSTGLLTSVGPAGQVSITARSGAFVATSAIAVTQVPTAIRVSPERLRMGRSRTRRLLPQMLDAVGVPIPSFSAFTYSSLNPSVVSVSTDGVVTSFSTIGQGVVRIAAIGASQGFDVPVEVLPYSSPSGTAVTILTLNNGAYSAAFTAGDSVVATSVFGPVVVVSASSGQSRAVAGSMQGPGVSYDVARNTTYLALFDGSIRQLTHTTGAMSEFIVLPPRTEVSGVLPSADGRSLYVSSSGSFFTVDVQTRTFRSVANTITSGIHLELHPDGQKLYASGNGSVGEWNLQTGSMRRLPLFSFLWQGSAVSSDGKYLYVANESGGLAQFDLVTEQLTHLPLAQCRGWGIAITRDDRFLYISCPREGTVVVYDIAARAAVARHTGLGEVRRVAMSLDGSIAAIASTLGVIIIR